MSNNTHAFHDDLGFEGRESNGALPETITKTLWLYIPSYDDTIRVTEHDPAQYSSDVPTILGSVEMEIPVPHAGRGEIVARQVQALRNQQQKVRAEAEVKAQQIEERIGRLLALSHDGGSH